MKDLKNFFMALSIAVIMVIDSVIDKIGELIGRRTK